MSDALAARRWFQRAGTGWLIQLGPLYAYYHASRRTVWIALPAGWWLSVGVE